MLYRTSGQFKTSYRADQALFPIRQDAFLLTVILIDGCNLVIFKGLVYLLYIGLFPFFSELINKCLGNEMAQLDLFS